jgi:hypothetical protein
MATIAPRILMAREAGDAVAAESVPSADVDQILLLDVQVNGHSIGKIGEFTMHNGRLMARPSELRDLGFKVPASLAPDANGMIGLAALTDLTWRLDQPNLVLHITVSDSGLMPTMLRYRRHIRQWAKRRGRSRRRYRINGPAGIFAVGHCELGLAGSCRLIVYVQGTWQRDST